MPIYTQDLKVLIHSWLLYIKYNMQAMQLGQEPPNAAPKQQQPWREPQQ